MVGGSGEDKRPSTFDPTTGEFTALVPPQNESTRWGPAGATFDSGAICVAGGLAETFGEPALDGGYLSTTSN